MIVFLNCYEEMATGMRMLAALAQEKGFAVHILVLRGYHVTVSDRLDEKNESMHVCVNGTFHVNPNRTRPFSLGELELVREKLRGFNPELVCISTRSANDAVIPSVLRAAHEACPQAPIICGGYGPTYAPEYYLRNGADIVLRGEGEIAFSVLLDNLRTGRTLRQTPNACYLDEGKLVQLPMAAPLHDITHLPSPLVGDDVVTFIDTTAKDGKQKAEAYAQERDPAFDRATFDILIGRGCIGRCAYCAAPVLGGYYAAEGHCIPKYRRRDYEQVLRELEQVRAHGVRRVFFKDEYLVDQPGRLAEFFRQYRKRIDLPFRANLHPEQLLRHPALLESVLDADMYGYTIGFEAGNEAMARDVYGRPHSFDVLKRLAHLLFNQFVSLQYHFVSGTSLNTEKEFQAKCELMAALPYDPAMPGRTLCMDFQFFPQPLSRLSQKLGEGTMFRLPVREWAVRALRAQLRHFATEEEICQAEDELGRVKDGVAFLQQRSRELRAARAGAHYRRFAREMAGRDVLVMGEATPDYAAQGHLLAESRIVGRIAFPGHAASAGRMDADRIAAEYGEQMPVILFGGAYHRFPRYLRRRTRLKNPLYGVLLP